MIRRIYWTDSAKHWVLWNQTTRAEWANIVGELDRIAHIVNLNLCRGVEPIIQTKNEWHRLKITYPSQIRVVFSATDRPPRIIVHAVMRRHERTYDQIEILHKAEKGKERIRHEQRR